MSKERETRPHDKDDDRKAFGERLREAREYLGFTQDQVATFMGISHGDLSFFAAIPTYNGVRHMLMSISRVSQCG